MKTIPLIPLQAGLTAPAPAGAGTAVTVAPLTEETMVTSASRALAPVSTLLKRITDPTAVHPPPALTAQLEVDQFKVAACTDEPSSSPPSSSSRSNAIAGQSRRAAAIRSPQACQPSERKAFAMSRRAPLNTTC